MGYSSDGIFYAAYIQIFHIIGVNGIFKARAEMSLVKGKMSAEAVTEVICLGIFRTAADGLAVFQLYICLACQQAVFAVHQAVIAVALGVGCNAAGGYGKFDAVAACISVDIIGYLNGEICGEQAAVNDIVI